MLSSQSISVAQRTAVPFSKLYCAVFASRTKMMFYSNNNCRLSFSFQFISKHFLNKKSFFAKVEINSEKSNAISIVVVCQDWIDNFVVSIFQLPDFSWNT